MKEKLAYCLNCEQDLPQLENYCSNCGQKNHATKLTIWSFLKELVQSIFNFDTRVWVTLKMALFKVGQLAQEFNQGKRKKYVRPIQFYLFCSLIYFLLVGIIIKKYQPDTSKIKEHIAATDTLRMTIFRSDLTLSQAEIKILPTLSNPQLDSLLEAKNIKSDFFAYNLLLRESLKMINSGPKSVLQQLFSIISFGMFALMPILAWLLFLFFSNQYLFYVEHLIFSVYLHSIIFLILSTKLLTNFMGFMGWSNFVFYFGAFLYALIGTKQFYNYNWFKTIFYFLVVMLLHGCILVSFIMTSLIVSILLTQAG